MVQSHSLLFGDVLSPTCTGSFLSPDILVGFQKLPHWSWNSSALDLEFVFPPTSPIYRQLPWGIFNREDPGPPGSGALMCFVYQSLGRLLWLMVCPYQDPAKVQPPRSSDLSPSLLPGDVPHPLACLTSILLARTIGLSCWWTSGNMKRNILKIKP